MTHPIGSADKVLVDTLKALLDNGDHVTCRGRETLETGAEHVIFMRQCVTTLKARKLNYRFAAAEALWILRGHSTLYDLGEFAKFWEPYSDDGIRSSGAYGPPFAEQSRYIVELLRADPTSRQAVMTFWRPNPRSSKDIPCTVSMQIVIREGQLNCFVHMRSSDTWLGLPYDMIVFSCIALQLLYAIDKELTLGVLRIVSPCQHIYLDDRPAIEALLLDQAIDNTGWLDQREFFGRAEFQQHLEAVSTNQKSAHNFLCKKFFFIPTVTG